MQEKRNIRLLISLAGLITITVLILWLGSTDRSFQIDKTIFKVADTKSIDHVTLQATAGTVDIKFDGARWKINGRYDADRNMIDVLFATLERAEPKRPVAKSLQDSTGTAIRKNGVKIVLYAGNEILKTFYAGGNERKTQAYFTDLENGATYAMIIPGYRTYVSGIFELSENNWRDKLVFDLNWRNFKMLSVTFKNDPKQNFTVSFNDKFLEVIGMPSADTTKLNDLMYKISALNADQFIDKDSPLYDSTVLTSSLCELEITDVGGTKYSLSLFAGKNSPDVLGRTGAGELVLFRRQQVTPVVRGRDYFSGRQTN